MFVQDHSSTILWFSNRLEQDQHLDLNIEILFHNRLHSGKGPQLTTPQINTK